MNREIIVHTSEEAEYIRNECTRFIEAKKEGSEMHIHQLSHSSTEHPDGEIVIEHS